MTLDLGTLALFIVGALIYGAFVPPRFRGWALLVASVAAVYILQPPLPIRFSDFILPTATVVLTAGGWYLTRQLGTEVSREDRIALGVIAAVVSGLSLMRFVDADFRLTPSRPPDPLLVLLALAVIAGVVLVVERAGRRSNALLTGAIAVIVLLFVALKSEPLATEVSRLWRAGTGQDLALAGIIDLNWLGFSYVAFRLIHTLRDRQNGVLPALTLREYATYVLFFPAFVAGPIDRAERFVKDFRALPEKLGLDAARYLDGGTRIALGVCKKFVIADSLALGLALNPVTADQAESAPALWLLLYGYALRLYFDFSGYTDIVIGIGILFGIRLPENFNRPYLKTNIGAFWQSWHITLSNWARFYIFSQVSRSLLTRKPKPSPVVVMLIAQMATMIVIGLWHGIALNFLIWGLWHGIGVFVHKQWSDRTRVWYRRLSETPRRKQAWSLVGWFLTFQFVALGWVWFVLPVEQAARVLARMFGG